MLTLPETPGHPYRGVLAGPHLSRPCRFLVPPPFESLSLTLAGSGRVFVTGAGVRNHLILRRRSCVAKLDAGCFPHNSQPRQERKKNQKRKNAATTPPKTYSQLHRSYYKGSGGVGKRNLPEGNGAACTPPPTSPKGVLRCRLRCLLRQELFDHRQRVARAVVGQAGEPRAI